MRKSILKADFIYWNNVYFVLLLRLAVTLFILSISRICLYFTNIDSFIDFSFQEIFMAYLSGFRFDISVLFFFSILLILGNALPFSFRRNNIYQKLINLITLTIISVAIILNLSDAIYYRFTLKRMTFDIFHYLNENGGFIEVAPRFLIDFWYVTIIGVILISMLIFSFIKIKMKEKKEVKGWYFYGWNILMLAFLTFITVWGIRGGIGKSQYKPITTIDASKHTSIPLTPLVLNTPFTIMKSYGLKGLQVKSDFTKKEVEKIYNPIQSYQPLEGVPQSVKNVVLIILESFSSEHFGYFNHDESFTPFLDSLLEHSLVFSATANGKRSIEGIPAILSSLPSLSNESFINGNYTANKIEGLASTLNKHDYETAFFHGGKNGTMNFDSYALSSGFQSYYGLNEYSNEDDYDGNWGIEDEPYLQYFAETINEFPNPFFAATLTLSSHHPYNIPEKYKNVLPSGKLKIQQAIAYTDLSIRKFFDNIKTKAWFNNTLFVFTADHTSQGVSPRGRNSLGQFDIPIAFYSPLDTLLSNRYTKSLVQQTDIFPSVLHYLGIPDTVLCFGNSVFDSESKSFAINYYGQKIQIMDSIYFLQIQNDEPLSLYKYKEDSLLKNNLVKSEDFSQLMTFYKAYIQQYNNRMIENELKVRDEKRKPRP